MTVWPSDGIANDRSGQVVSATARELADPDWAWAAYEPDARRPWNLALAAHLYRRAGFGANWSQLQRAVAEGPQRTVDRLLRPDADVEAFNRTQDDYEDGRSVTGLRAWWLRRMIETPHPLLEKMTLFWHGFFATNGGTLKQPRLMRAHLRLLRRHALGSFASLLRNVVCDPALLLWLGADANRKGAPNEGLAHPLLEVFTVGPSECSVEDIRAVARAFTGWFVLRGQLRYLQHEHDDGPACLLGHEGNFSRDDVLDILLDHPATARRVVRRLCRWLISEQEELSEALIAPLAQSLSGDYRVAGTVETMLRSNLFFCRQSYRAKIKCPVEFAVGLVHALEGMVATAPLGEALAAQSQNLCQPPTVKGWAGGRHWINGTSLLQRHNLSLSLLEGQDPYGAALNPWAMAQRHQCATLESAARLCLQLLVQDDLPSTERESLVKESWASANNEDGATEVALRRLAHAIANLPEFQLA